MKQGQLLVLFVCAALVLGAFAAPLPVFGQNETKTKSKKSKKSEGPDVYRQWLDEVSYIITKPERDAFLKLQTDEEREQFIEHIWYARDPDPDTPTNEYREEYYRRIAYANEHFASGIPGWKTDRGRIYITFGPPDSIEAHPAGGPYERPSYEGGGSTSTYPFEIWFYRNLEGVDSGLEVEFVDPTGSGEYRLARDPAEKDALLFTPNGGLTLLEQLGISRKADRAFFNPANHNANGRRQDQPFEKLGNLIKLSQPPELRRKTGQIEQIVDFSTLLVTLRTDYFRAGDTACVAAFTVQLANADLSFGNASGIQTARVNLFGQLRALSGRSKGSFEDTAVISFSEGDLALGLKQSSLYQKNLLLEPGRYKLDLVVRDLTSGHTGVLHHGFEIPRYDREQLMTSSLVLADILQPIGQINTADRFRIGNNKVRPSVSQEFSQGQNLGVFLQLYNAPLDQTTLKPAVAAVYSISQNGKEILTVAEDGTNGLSDLSGSQHLTLARSLPLNQLEPGEYELTVRITDRISRTSITPSTRFTVTANKQKR